VHKLINYFFYEGKKRWSENNLLKISKNLQKNSKKNFRNIIKLTLVFSTSIFKINILQNNKRKKTTKKSTFSLIQKSQVRLSLAIKYLIKTVCIEKSVKFYKIFYKKLLFFLKNKNFTVQKKDNQKQVFLNRHIFFYYRWR